MPTYSCIQDWTVGGIGNTSDDPTFADEDGDDDNLSTWQDNDLHLSPASAACIDTGDPDLYYTGQTDIDGQTRVWDGDADGQARADIGADEIPLTWVCWDGSRPAWVPGRGPVLDCAPCTWSTNSKPIMTLPAPDSPFSTTLSSAHGLLETRHAP